MEFVRPVPNGYPITRMFGEVGASYSHHINEDSGLWLPGRLCAGCRKLEPCGCLNPDPYGNHKGVDFACPESTPVVACIGGMIIRSGKGRDASPHAQGDVIVQLVSAIGYDSYWLTYRNIRESLIKPGQAVKAGDRIAYSGYCGVGSPYLHIELQDRAMQFRPLPVPPTPCDSCVHMRP